jgi:hypothetical protein
VSPPTLHEPLPLHVLAAVCVADEHDAPAHAVPADHLRQAPLPLHAPSSPHVDALLAVQSLLGSSPSATFPQVPVVHAWQAPVHAELQQ